MTQPITGKQLHGQLMDHFAAWEYLQAEASRSTDDIPSGA